MIGLVLVTHGRLADEFRAAFKAVLSRHRIVAFGEISVAVEPVDLIRGRQAGLHGYIKGAAPHGFIGVAEEFFVGGRRRGSRMGGGPGRSTRVRTDFTHG